MRVVVLASAALAVWSSMAVSASVPTPADVSHGLVSITPVSDPATGGDDLVFRLSGTFAVEGAAFTGVATGSSVVTWTDPPTFATFPLTGQTAKGTVGGDCTGTGDRGGDRAELACMLSVDGRTPWLTQLELVTPSTRTWDTTTSRSGVFVAVEPTVGVVHPPVRASYGDAELQSDEGSATPTWGPLRLAGTFDIAGHRYVGEIASGVFSGGVAPSPFPVSGTGFGDSVTGDCSTSALLPTPLERNDVSCTLSLDGAAAAPVDVTVFWEQTGSSASYVSSTVTGDGRGSYYGS